LGVARPEGIWLDASGAGLGWNTSLLTPNSQLLTSSYDLLTVVTHELGHVLGYDDLDGKGDGPLLPERPEGCCAQKGTVPFSSGDDIMAGVLHPGASRVEIPAGRGLGWLVGAPSPLLALERVDEGRSAAGGRGLLVDRVIDDLLRDDLRVSKDAWQPRRGRRVRVSAHRPQRRRSRRNRRLLRSTVGHQTETLAGNRNAVKDLLAWKTPGKRW
jgi:hypothetical protein